MNIKIVQMGKKIIQMDKIVQMNKKIVQMDIKIEPINAHFFIFQQISIGNVAAALGPDMWPQGSAL